MIEVLKRKKLDFSKINVELFIKEDPTTCVIITPIMQRVFEDGLVDEMVFIDTSGSCDQTNACVTFLFAATKIGALPVVVILHTSQLHKCFPNSKKLFRRNMPKGLRAKNHYD